MFPANQFHVPLKSVLGDDRPSRHSPSQENAPTAAFDKRLRIVLGLLPVFGVLLSGTHAAAISYTMQQYGAGQAAYVQQCSSCHGRDLTGRHLAPALIGDRFDLTWRDKSADNLMFHMRRMPLEPVGEPGSLDDNTYADILAYILKSNGIEPGDEKISSDPEKLSKAKIPRLRGAEVDPYKPAFAPGESERISNLPPLGNEALVNPDPADWPQNGRTYDASNFSPLKQIDRVNVANLSVAWRLPLQPGTAMPMPVVYKGVMFLHTFPDTVLAIDAAEGRIIWRFRYEPRGGSSQKLGVSPAGDKVLVPTSDLHVIALDIKTGTPVWDHAIETESPNAEGVRGLTTAYNLRSSPLIVGDKVIQGITSSFAPRGGFILAIDLETGKEAWRFNTIARPGEPFGNTWNDLPVDARSGGSVWHLGSYDPGLDLLYFGIAPTYDTGPMLIPSGKEGVTNEALYTNCTVALDPKSGRLAWHYQHMPNDQWDLDWVFERQIAEIPVNGESRKVVMNVGKMGILEALDAATGEYLFSIDAGMQNVITGIDPETGEKTIDVNKLPDPDRATDICPSAYGARSWPPTSYSPETKLSYLPLTESCMTFGKRGMRLLTSGVGISNAPHPDSEDGKFGQLQGVDLAERKPAWVYHNATPFSTSAMSTAGGLVFTGDMDPSLKAFDAESGEPLWRAGLDALPSCGLVTYAVDGRQHVSVVTGMNNFHINTLKSYFKDYGPQENVARSAAARGGAAVWTFALPAAE